MVITPDNRTLIISESFSGRLTAFDIGADGGLSNRRVFADGLGPDGICLDAEGAVWVSTGGSSIVRVAEDGARCSTREMIVEIDAQHVAPGLPGAYRGACPRPVPSTPDARCVFVLPVLPPRACVMHEKGAWPAG